MTAPDQCQDPLLRVTLRCGSVYYFQERHLTSSEPHYFIVINADPLHDSAILLVMASTKLQKVRARRRDLPSDTLVEVPLGEYSGFPDPSIIDCNTIFEHPLSLLIEKRRERTSWRNLNDFPKPLMAKVIAGVHKSPIHKPAIKSRIPPIS